MIKKRIVVGAQIVYQKFVHNDVVIDVMSLIEVVDM